MATNLSISPYHHSSDTNNHRPLPFTAPLQLSAKRSSTISCNSSKRPPPRPSADPKTPSLAEQLKPLSTTTLSDQPNTTQQQPLLSKTKSTWVNPTRPKPSVLSLQRHKRSTSYSYNPQIKDLRQFAAKLNDCEESEFLDVVAEFPLSPTRENVLLVLNTLKSWQTALLFFNWVKSQDLFPIETVFYNVTMKSLRFGRQFHHIEALALEMVQQKIELDNITYSTIITCAKRCNLCDKALEWFEHMYKTGVMPDEVTYSAVLDVYAKLGKVEEVRSLYERGIASGWKPDCIAFAVLGKMFGEAGDYDGIMYVLQEMKSVEVKPNLVVYNTLLEAMGKTQKPRLARSLFEEMVGNGIAPNEKTLTALIKIYGRARWARDALQLWEQMKSNQWPMDLKLYNTLLSMCADIGLVEEAEKLFEDMKESEMYQPDSWSYTAMLNIYGSGKNVDKAMDLFKEMLKVGVKLNVMGCTCLIQCLGRAKKMDDLVDVFESSLKEGIKPDDRLSGCLLSVIKFCENEDADKVLCCLNQANPRLASFVKMVSDNETEIAKEELKSILSNTAVDSRRPFCNCLIEICRNRKQYEKAHELLYLGTLYGLYPGLHTKTQQEWRLNVRSLSVGAAHTAFEEWMSSLATIVECEGSLPAVFSVNSGAGTHNFAQGLGTAFGSHLKKLGVPFRKSEEKAGFYLATREELVLWLQSETANAETK